MKIKFDQLRQALEHVTSKANIRGKNFPVDLVLREEDLEKNKLGECLTITFEAKYTADQYDSIKTDIIREFTLEVFAEHENRPPRLTLTETRELEFKKD